MIEFLKKTSTWAFAIISALFTFVSDDILKNCKVLKNCPDEVNIVLIHILIYIVIFVLSVIVYAIYLKYRKKEYIKGHNYCIKIEYGNIFEMDNCKIVTRILDGEFLNYKSVIPDNWETRVEVNKSNLQNSFERISLISASSVEKEKKYPVKINVDIGKVVISCTNQTGDAKEELFVSTEGKNLEAGFNPKYFLDCLKAIDDENVYVEFGTSISPCLIKSTENRDYVYMILPIRLKED